jgi:hypothetical protein
MPKYNTITLNIPDAQWEAIGYDTDTDPNVRLAAPMLLINGSGFHLHAGLAEIVDDCVGFADPAMAAEVMPAIQALWPGACHLTTIHGRQYIVYGFPFSE